VLVGREDEEEEAERQKRREKFEINFVFLRSSSTNLW